MLENNDYICCVILKSNYYEEANIINNVWCSDECLCTE